ncbi:protein POLLEN DEFECTIVE IN GUIDANCE 1 [Dorcoceras hygrometricum]|uniref:Protein POLLEN DEFECTIVE IN GUIDANCE 1 n=1 Tax=Dorcoceras hygrometricum TaxID=472368 RepID=A0A2Z7BRV6_9LAMI|nr:protein POLLEN DEFECTIVE IN GUIDANCE 1 [Dorcoceras hygrometricum]
MLYSKLQSRNDTLPTKRNDAAAFYQQATISRAKNQMLVVEFPSKPISSWLRKITQNDDASTNLDDAVLDMPHRYQLLVNQQASILHNDSKPAVALTQTTWNRICEVCWRSIEEEQFSSKLQCSEVEEISCRIEAKKNRESAVMTSAYILSEAMSSKDDVITISSYQEVQDLESAMMTSAVMSSQSADEESSAGALSVDDISSDVINQQGVQQNQSMEIQTQELKRHHTRRLINSADGFALRTSRYNSQEKPSGSYSTSRRKQQYIQSRKNFKINVWTTSRSNEKENQMRSELQRSDNQTQKRNSCCAKCCDKEKTTAERTAVEQLVGEHSVVPTSGQPVAAMKRKTRCEVNCKGATTRRRKETAVARSVVTKKRQQLSEQLLNNLLENIQLLDTINAQDGRING